MPRGHVHPSRVSIVFLLIGLAGCGAQAEQSSSGGSQPPDRASAVAGAGDSAALAFDASDESGELDDSVGVVDPPGTPEGSPANAVLPRANSGGGQLQRPEHQRGVYLTAWVAGSSTRSQELIELARRTEINTFVIDVKDASGFVSYRTDVALAHEIGADGEIRIRDVRALLERLEAEGIWPIARIMVMQDPILARARPDMSVQDRDGGPWVDGRGDVWVNPWDRRVWDYHADLAREAVALGFREIQWDYIRFPDRPGAELATAVYPGAEGRPRTAAVQGFLIHTRSRLEDLGVPLTADVFGVTTSAGHDVGIGQLWEDFIGLVDAALPMVYPSHYAAGSFGIQDPNAHPYEIVHSALRLAIRRSEAIEGAGRIIPWLQAFTLGPPPYGSSEIRAQIQAVYDLGLTEWILWNPSSRYVESALEPAPGPGTN